MSGEEVRFVAQSLLDYSAIDVPRGDSFDHVTERSSNQFCRFLRLYIAHLRPTQAIFSKFSGSLWIKFSLKQDSFLIAEYVNLHVDHCCDKLVISFIDMCITFEITQYVWEPKFRNGHIVAKSSEVSFADLWIYPGIPYVHWFVSFDTRAAIFAKPSIFVTGRRIY